MDKLGKLSLFMISFWSNQNFKGILEKKRILQIIFGNYFDIQNQRFWDKKWLTNMGESSLKNIIKRNKRVTSFLVTKKILRKRDFVEILFKDSLELTDLLLIKP